MQVRGSRGRRVACIALLMPLVAMMAPVGIPFVADPLTAPAEAAPADALGPADVPVLPGNLAAGPVLDLGTVLEAGTTDLPATVVRPAGPTSVTTPQPTVSPSPPPTTSPLPGTGSGGNGDTDPTPDPDPDPVPPGEAAGCDPGTTTAATTTVTATSGAAATMPAITVGGSCILRGGEPWWFAGYNSFVWSGDCGDPEERMSAADVDRWFASMRHDGHGAVRLFFFEGWDLTRLDAAVASAKRHEVYLTITLDDAIGGCGENDKDAAWFANGGETAAYERHMRMLLERFRGETAIAWFEFFNEPDDADGALRAFYDEMGAVADSIDRTRLFSSGTVAPYWVDGEANFRAIHESRGVDIASLHEYDEGEVESNHGPRVRANSAGKPVIVGEFGIVAGGSGCLTFTERARRFDAKLGAYTGQGYAGAFGWAWQPGRSGCELGNLDVDTATQQVLRAFADAGSVSLAALPPAAAPSVLEPDPPTVTTTPPTSAPPTTTPPTTTPPSSSPTATSTTPPPTTTPPTTTPASSPTDGDPSAGGDGTGANPGGDPAGSADAGSAEGTSGGTGG